MWDAAEFKSNIRLDGNKMYQFLLKEIEALFQETVDAGVATMADILSRHVDTGMSIASLYPMGGPKTAAIISAALAGSRGPKKYSKQLTGSFSDHPQVKSPQTGEQLGRAALLAKVWIKETNLNEGYLYFRLNTKIFQHYLHEWVPTTRGFINYRSIESLVETMNDYWKQQAPTRLGIRRLVQAAIIN